MTRHSVADAARRAQGRERRAAAAAAWTRCHASPQLHGPSSRAAQRVDGHSPPMRVARSSTRRAQQSDLLALPAPPCNGSDEITQPRAVGPAPPSGSASPQCPESPPPARPSRSAARRAHAAQRAPPRSKPPRHRVACGEAERRGEGAAPKTGLELNPAMRGEAAVVRHRPAACHPRGRSGAASEDISWAWASSRTRCGRRRRGAIACSTEDGGYGQRTCAMRVSESKSESKTKQVYCAVARIHTHTHTMHV